jgi:hypothetical protein
VPIAARFRPVSLKGKGQAKVKIQIWPVLGKRAWTQAFTLMALFRVRFGHLLLPVEVFHCSDHIFCNSFTILANSAVRNHSKKSVIKYVLILRALPWMIPSMIWKNCFS